MVDKKNLFHWMATGKLPRGFKKKIIYKSLEGNSQKFMGELWWTKYM